MAAILQRLCLWRKFWRLPWPHRLLLIEATVLLAMASLAIALLPFRQLGRLAALPIRRPQLQPNARITAVRDIRWAVTACADRVPWRAVCFQQGLTAQLMSRRRGIPSILYFGAAPSAERGLAAHVWVRDGDTDVIGEKGASRFAVLATFPTFPASCASTSFAKIIATPEL